MLFSGRVTKFGPACNSGRSVIVNRITDERETGSTIHVDRFSLKQVHNREWLHNYAADFYVSIFYLLLLLYQPLFVLVAVCQPLMMMMMTMMMIDNDTSRH